MPLCRKTPSGFTLTELLVVIAVIAILSAILFPAFAQAREKGRQTACLSSERQIGLAIFQYAQDYDERFPQGLNDNNGSPIWPAEGWAGQCLPYLKSPAVFRCASDATQGTSSTNVTVSQGYNINLVDWDVDEPAYGIALAQLSRPSRSVLLFEVSGVTANVTDSREGAYPGGVQGTHFSASANGLDNRLYAQKQWVTRLENQYATGYLGGRLPFNPSATQFASPEGRHAGGSNFMLCDGHLQWLRGSQVSSGWNSPRETCNQDNLPALAGCEGAFHAAGASNDGGGIRATFSSR